MGGGEELNKLQRDPEAMGEGNGEAQARGYKRRPWSGAEAGCGRCAGLELNHTANLANLQLVVGGVGDLALDLLAWAPARRDVMRSSWSLATGLWATFVPSRRGLEQWSCSPRCCGPRRRGLHGGVGCDMTSGGGEVPRAMLTANAWSRASCESVGDGGRGVSAARRAAASCSWARRWWWSSLTRRRGAGMAAAASSSPRDEELLCRVGECACGGAISWTPQKEPGCARQQVLQRRRLHCAFPGRGAGRALGAWCSGWTRMFGRRVGGREGIVLGG
ncbi:hypothetical protein B0H14DRAFT_2612588, partial [Mycena olivaceomarginata]